MFRLISVFILLAVSSVSFASFSKYGEFRATVVSFDEKNVVLKGDKQKTITVARSLFAKKLKVAQPVTVLVKLPSGEMHVVQ